MDLQCPYGPYGPYGLLRNRTAVSMVMTNPKPPWHRDKNNGCQQGVHGEDSAATGKRGSVMPSGLHHMAIICKVSLYFRQCVGDADCCSCMEQDMEETVRFYESVLGLRLRAIFPMHGIPQVMHVHGVAKQKNSDRMISGP